MDAATHQPNTIGHYSDPIAMHSRRSGVASLPHHESQMTLAFSFVRLDYFCSTSSCCLGPNTTEIRCVKKALVPKTIFT